MYFSEESSNLAITKTRYWLLHSSREITWWGLFVLGETVAVDPFFIHSARSWRSSRSQHHPDSRSDLTWPSRGSISTCNQEIWFARKQAQYANQKTHCQPEHTWRLSFLAIFGYKKGGNEREITCYFHFIPKILPIFTNLVWNLYDLSIWHLKCLQNGLNILFNFVEKCPNFTTVNQCWNKIFDRLTTWSLMRPTNKSICFFLITSIRTINFHKFIFLQ